MDLLLPFALLLAAFVLITMAITGSSARNTVSGQADTSKLHQQPGA